MSRQQSLSVSPPWGMSWQALACRRASGSRPHVQLVLVLAVAVQRTTADRGFGGFWVMDCDSICHLPVFRLVSHLRGVTPSTGPGHPTHLGVSGDAGRVCGGIRRRRVSRLFLAPQRLQGALQGRDTRAVSCTQRRSRKHRCARTVLAFSWLHLVICASSQKQAVVGPYNHTRQPRQVTRCLLPFGCCLLQGCPAHPCQPRPAIGHRTAAGCAYPCVSCSRGCSDTACHTGVAAGGRCTGCCRRRGDARQTQHAASSSAAGGAADLRCYALPQVTPFLLESIRNKTGGKSLAANIQLVKNNAAVGSQIAAALSALG